MLGLGVSQGLKLEQLKINGKKHVLFKTGDGKISVVDAVCPHRGANLCKGRVKGNNIQCPYQAGNLIQMESLSKFLQRITLCVKLI